MSVIQSNIRVQLAKHKKEIPTQYVSSDTDSSASEKSNHGSPPYEYNPEYDEMRCEPVMMKMLLEHHTINPYGAIVLILRFLKNTLRKK